VCRQRLLRVCDSVTLSSREFRIEVLREMNDLVPKNSCPVGGTFISFRDKDVLGKSFGGECSVVMHTYF